MKKFNTVEKILFVSLLLSFSILAPSKSIIARSFVYTIHSYEYPINQNSEVWPSLTIEEKRESLEIPSYVLENMSDSSLYDAFIKYPFLSDILAYVNRPTENLLEPLEKLSKYCSAYQEILRRGLTLSELQIVYENYNELNNESSRSESNQNDYGQELIAQVVMDGIFKTELDIYPNLEDSINRLKVSKSTYISDEYPDLSQSPIQYIKTPKGTSVQVFIWTDTLTYPERVSLGMEGAKIYNVTYLAPATNKYNCHSYVWYKADPSKIYTMNDPSAYMRDGSYRKTPLTNLAMFALDAQLAAGQRVYYGNGNHTAIVEPIAQPLGNSVGDHYGRSKFGALGLYRHKLGNTPYDSSSISAWR